MDWVTCDGGLGWIGFKACVLSAASGREHNGICCGASALSHYEPLLPSSVTPFASDTHEQPFSRFLVPGTVHGSGIDHTGGHDRQGGFSNRQ
jgi:hypothetical protein